MTDLLTSDEQFSTVFDSLTEDERRELHKVLSSAYGKFSRVTLTLGDVAIKTEGPLTDLGSRVWEARKRFTDAGSEVFTIAMDDLNVT